MDQAGKTATLANGRKLKIPPGTYDLAGLAYAIREIDLSPGKSTRFTLLDDERLQTLLLPCGRREGS